MKIWRFCPKLGGGLKRCYFHQMFWLRDWVWHIYLMSDGSWSRIRFLFGRIVCSSNVIWSKNCPKFHCFGTFAGAGAHHEGLRWFKPCQFQRTVCWHCECDKFRPDARLQLLAVCCSWTRGHKQMSLVSLDFNWQTWKFQTIVEVTGKRLVCYWSLVRDL